MRNPAPLYEPRYYERAAQQHVARVLPGSCFINVPWGLTGSPTTRPELDAVVLLGRRVVPVEIKAYGISEAAAAAVTDKYRGLGFSDLILLTPAAEPGVAARLANSQRPAVDLVTFEPSLDEVQDWYRTQWPAFVPSWVHDTLATGHHHIRFVLARPTREGRFVIGQQRSRIYDAETLGRCLLRLPHPPARVLWTPQRFSIPRDLTGRRSRATALGGFVVVDVDGDRLHRAHHACQLDEVQGGCRLCLRYAAREYLRIRASLGEHDWIDLLTSGGRGLHIYYRDAGGIRSQLLDLARERAVRIDAQVTASLKSTVALPGSLHASMMRPVASMGAGELALTVPEIARC